MKTLDFKMMRPQRTKRKSRAVGVYQPEIVEQACWIVSDGYDRQAWEERAYHSSAISELISAGETLIPHFTSLLQDFFCALFKCNLEWRKPNEVRPSATLNRVILERLLSSTAFNILREKTVLEEDKAAIASVVLAERTIELVRSERFVNRRDLLDLWELYHQETNLTELAAALRNKLEGAPVDPQAKPNAELERKAHKLQEAAKQEAQIREARLRQKVGRVQEALKLARASELGRLELTSAELAQGIDELSEDVHRAGVEMGGSGRVSAAERLELGRRLARNKKLGQLARLVGRFKQLARAVRRRSLEKGVAEAYEIRRGSDVGRLIPAELLALNDERLRAEFKRRLLEGTLLQYELREDEEKGKGPVVVCLDVSSSMTGDKELWAKAVTLTLLDIARRQRRLFRAVLFSSDADTMRIFDLNRGRRYESDLKKILDLAEYFPGGGTNFEIPLNAAVDLLKSKALKRGDIVLITDGECEVSPEWLAEFKQLKRELNFALFAVLIDVGSNRLSTLATMCDRITAVSQLLAESAREIFVAI